jgi:hypothetical protein
MAMAPVAGARRTQSSFPVYLASTNPSDVEVFTEFDPITHVGYSSRVDDAIARVKYVERAADVIGFDGTLQVLGRTNESERCTGRPRFRRGRQLASESPATTTRQSPWMRRRRQRRSRRLGKKVPLAPSR